MTPLQAECHQRHKQFHAQIAYRAAFVTQDHPIARDVSIRPSVPNPEPNWWHCMWFGDLIAIRPPPPTHLTVEIIQRIVARYFGITKLDMISQRRTGDLILPRQIAVYFAKELTARSLPEIGRRFGGRDHTTMLYSVEKIRARIVSDPEFARTIATIRAEIV